VHLLIKRIELENVKSYRRASVDLSTGVNAITGENGAGKTTILEAVGFALFDYLPYNQRQFIRYGERRGCVSIEIVGRDGRDYRIVRQFGNSPKYYVEDVELRRQIVEGKEDVMRWLRDQMRISSSIEPDVLFREVVGVPQGNFTSIFLRRRSERAPIFEALFGIEDYRKTAERMNDVLRKIESEIAEQKEKLGELRGRTVNYEERKKEMEKYEKIVEDLRKRIDGVEKEVKKTQKSLQRLDGLKKRLEVLENELRTKKDLKHIIFKNYETQKRELEELEKNRREIERLKEAFEEFEKLKREVEELREKLNEKEKRDRELHSKIELLKRIEEEFENLREELKVIEEEKKRIEDIERSIRELESLETKLNELNEKEEKRKFAIKRIEELRKEVEKKIRRISEIEENLKNLDEIKKKVKVLEEKREKLKEISEGLRGIDESLKYLEELRNFLSSGICPFIQETCSRVSEEVIEERRMNLKEERERLISISKKLRDEIKNFEQYETKLSELKIFEREREILREELEEIRKEIKRLEKFAEISFERELKEVKSEVEELRVQKKVLGELKKRVQREEEIKILLKRREKEIYTLKIGIEEIKKEISDLNELRDEINRKSARMENLKNDYENYRKLPEIIERITRIKKELEKTTRELERIERDEKTIEDEIREIREIYDEKVHEEIKREAERFLNLLGDLKGRLKIAEDVLGRLREEIKFYEECMKKMRVLEERIKELERRREDVRRIKEILRDAIPLITEAHVSSVSEEARKIYSEIIGDFSQILSWNNDFGIRIKKGGEEREFLQMSGGEQMSAALAVRLALLKHLSTVDFAFFDEPTQNMDEERRGNFANCISNFRGIKQLVVISHDDTFESLVYNALRVEKTPEGSRIT